MSLIQKMITSINENKKIKNENLYCGYLGKLGKIQTNDGKQGYSMHRDSRVVCKPLTESQRNRYLRGKYHTFLDGENCQLDKYLVLRDSDIEYYLIPSQNKIVPYITLNQLEYADLIDEGDEMLVGVDKSFSKSYAFLNKISRRELRKIESELNELMERYGR